MSRGPIQFAALTSAAGLVIDQLQQGHHSALVAPPGCGASSLRDMICSALISGVGAVTILDLRTPGTVERAIETLRAVQPAAADGPRQYLAIDHAGRLLPADLTGWLSRIRQAAADHGLTCLWVGALDARGIQRDHGVQLCSVPRAHVTFPALSRDDLIAAYRAIAESHGCRWGEAILFLVLDFCGNDLALAEGLAEYLPGDWSTRLHDTYVWDRIGEWLKNDPGVNRYRNLMRALPARCQEYLALLRLGGKPPCPRTELLEEVDEDLRRLCLSGFLMQNLLPQFYQLRNLTMHLLVHEPLAPWDSYGPDLLFRRATNHRAAQLVQDVETMLRHLLLSTFHRIGPERVKAILEGKQCERDFMPSELNRALLDWAGTAYGEDAKRALNAMLVERRKAFRATNSVWSRVTAMMQGDLAAEERGRLPEYLRCVDYLTFTELGGVLLDLMDEVFPRASREQDKAKLRDRWRESIARISRLRNDVAHLRNVDFAEMENLAGMVEIMRNDVIRYAGWKP
jgi:hypothetical protein